MATKVVVLGAGGFIGRHLIYALSQELEEKFEIIKVKTNLQDQDSTINEVLRHRPDVVIQLGWTASGTPNYRNEESNMLWPSLTVALSIACQESKLSFIGIGSEVETNANPKDLYSVAKRETYLKLRNAISENRITWIRPGYVFDEICESPKVVKEICESLRNGLQPSLNEPEAGHDFIHVRDVVSGIIAIIQGTGFGLYELGSGKLRKVRELSLALGCEISQVEEFGFSSKTQVSEISRIQKLGWNPTYTEMFFDKKWTAVVP
jgi:nucleoside-diphosphate-sugar epimerase